MCPWTRKSALNYSRSHPDSDSEIWSEFASFLVMVCARRLQDWLLLFPFHPVTVVSFPSHSKTSLPFPIFPDIFRILESGEMCRLYAVMHLTQKNYQAGKLFQNNYRSFLITFTYQLVTCYLCCLSVTACCYAEQDFLTYMYVPFPFPRRYCHSHSH